MCSACASTFRAILLSLGIVASTHLVTAAPAVKGEPSLGWLQVDGCFIVDSTGKPFRLVGHGFSPINPFEWYGKTAEQIAAGLPRKCEP